MRSLLNKLAWARAPVAVFVLTMTLAPATQCRCHDVERLGKQLVQGAALVDRGADALLGGGLLEITRWQLGIVDLVAVLLVGPTSAVEAIVQEEQR